MEAADQATAGDADNADPAGIAGIAAPAGQGFGDANAHDTPAKEQAPIGASFPTTFQRWSLERAGARGATSPTSTTSTANTVAGGGPR